MTREVLHFFATHSFSGAREIEKCVLLIKPHGGSIALKDIPREYREAAQQTQKPYMSESVLREWVSIVQL